ncbi:50S ribosomal protein L13 [Candidatus Uhrbacteria bacterium]|nr:50S ribosomal protein L13 [Candidatus Uhrbacteria bacterium]
MKKETVTLDAKGRAAGRVATQAALLLQGKHTAAYAPHIDAPVYVKIENAGLIRITGKNKMKQKEFRHHSGHPGGLKSRSLESVWAKDPTEVLRHAIKRMLPKNNLLHHRMTRLTITK